MTKFPVIYVDLGRLSAIDVAELSDSQISEQFQKLILVISSEIENYKKENSGAVPRYAIVRENFLFSMSCDKKDMLKEMIQASTVDKILIFTTDVYSGSIVGIIRHVFLDYSESEFPVSFKKGERGYSYALLQLNFK